RLHGRFSLRVCILNHSTGLADVNAVLDFLEREEAPDTAPAPRYERNPDVTESLFPAPLQIFSSLNGEEAEQVAALATEREAQPGETVVEQWGSERDFFVIVDGTADVFVGDDHVRSLGPGEFFGELAALDWGAGYGYSRLATVLAGTVLRADAAAGRRAADPGGRAGAARAVSRVASVLRSVFGNRDLRSVELAF